MTRILKRGQKTYFKEDVVTCLADETMQKIFTQSEYGNRTVWMEEDEILIDRDNDYVLLRDPDENVKQIWTASGEFLSTVQLENETVDKAMEEYYHNISKGDIEL